mgnify:CR=1 FL=1
MKVISLQNNIHAKRKPIIFIGAISLCLAILLYHPTRDIISSITYRGAQSIFVIGNAASDSLANLFGSFRAKNSLVKENSDLREEISRMQAQVLDRNLLEERLQMIEESRGHLEDDNRVISTVISTPWRSPYDTLVIDRGEEVGIRQGDLVVYAGSSALGRIVEVYPSGAKIMLFSSPQEKELAVLIGESRIPAKSRGRGMGNFEAKMPQGSAISVGSDVLLVEDPSIILGVVGLVEEKDSTLLMRVLFRTPFNIAEVRQVEVLIGSIIS